MPLPCALTFFPNLNLNPNLNLLPAKTRIKIKIKIKSWNPLTLADGTGGVSPANAALRRVYRFPWC